MQNIPKVGQIYKHFKGNLYQIVAIAEHTESGEEMVVYQALYGAYKVYARPLEMFLSRVDGAKYPEVMQEYRFELLPVLAGGLGQSAPVQAQMEVPVGAVMDAAEKKPIEEALGTSAVGEPSVKEPAEEKPALDQGIWEFLDAETYEQRLRIFTGMQHRLTDDMINIMAVSMDTEVSEGELSERIASLKSFLQMQVKFECNRVR